MQLDFTDIFGSSVGRVLGTALFLASGIWIGSFVGGFALVCGSGVSGIGNAEALSLSPLLLFNLWLVLNVAFLALMVIWIFAGDGQGYASWGFLAGMESLFVMLGKNFEFSSPGEIILSWLVWLVTLAMLETGVWLLHQWRRNIWARELAALSAENAMRRAEREAAAESDGSETDPPLAADPP